jgi:hypothetical protein
MADSAHKTEQPTAVNNDSCDDILNCVEMSFIGQSELNIRVDYLIDFFE